MDFHFSPLTSRPSPPFMILTISCGFILPFHLYPFYTIWFFDPLHLLLAKPETGRRLTVRSPVYIYIRIHYTTIHLFLFVLAPTSYRGTGFMVWKLFKCQPVGPHWTNEIFECGFLCLVPVQIAYSKTPSSCQWHCFLTWLLVYTLIFTGYWSFSLSWARRSVIF